MIQHFFFYCALALLLIHEMDAVRCREWTIFPGLSGLAEQRGRTIFVFAHVPLYLALLLLLTSEYQNAFITSLNVFFLIHLGLHIGFLKHPKNLFTDQTSWTLIGGAAFFGLLDLASSRLLPEGSLTLLR